MIGMNLFWKSAPAFVFKALKGTSSTRNTQDPKSLKLLEASALSVRINRKGPDFAFSVCIRIIVSRSNGVHVSKGLQSAESSLEGQLGNAY